jgi:hypothetical protein
MESSLLHSLTFETGYPTPSTLQKGQITPSGGFGHWFCYCGCRHGRQRGDGSHVSHTTPVASRPSSNHQPTDVALHSPLLVLRLAGAGRRPTPHQSRQHSPIERGREGAGTIVRVQAGARARRSQRRPRPWPSRSQGPTTLCSLHYISSQFEASPHQR